MGDLRLIALGRFVSPPMRNWRYGAIFVPGTFRHKIVSEISNVDPNPRIQLDGLGRRIRHTIAYLILSLYSVQYSLRSISTVSLFILSSILSLCSDYT